MLPSVFSNATMQIQRLRPGRINSFLISSFGSWKRFSNNSNTIIPVNQIHRSISLRKDPYSSSASTGGGATAPDNQTVLKDEVEKFEKLASNWWSMSGEFKALHEMNKLRVPFIRDGFLNNKQIQTSDVEFPLNGLSIIDIGCGGGILSLPLGKLGANVTGLDVGHENIVRANAELHAPSSSSLNLQERVRFVNTTLEDFVNNTTDQFDGVVVSEVIEHVANPKYFLQLAAELVKPNGSLFLTTINKTFLSWIGAILAAEYIFRLLPVGTHDWKQFKTPEEIQTTLHHNGLNTRLLHGMKYNVLTNSWDWSRCTDISYALHAVKSEL